VKETTPSGYLGSIEMKGKSINKSCTSGFTSDDEPA